MWNCGWGYYVNHVRFCFEINLIFKIYFVESSYLDGVGVYVENSSGLR